MSKVHYLLLVGLLVLAALAGCRSAHTTAAILYIDEQNYDKAVQVIHEGFQYVDNEPDAYYYLGEAYSHLAEEAIEDDDYIEARKNYELAYEAYQRVLEIDRKKWEEEVQNSIYYNYSNRLMQAKRDLDEAFYEQAEGHLRLAYVACPDSLTPVKNIARMKMKLANDLTGLPDQEEQRSAYMEEALSLLDQVLSAHPDAYLLRADKANVLAGLGRNVEARALFDELLQEHGDDDQLLVDIANLAIADQDFERAADFFVRVVDLRENDTDPNNDDQNKQMLVSAGTWYAGRNIQRFEDAIRVLDRAANLEIVPQETTMLSRLTVHYQYGMKLKEDAEQEADPAAKAELNGESRRILQRAVEIGNAMTQEFSGNPDGFFFLGSSQQQLGDTAAAQRNFQTYQELRAGGAS